MSEPFVIDMSKQVEPLWEAEDNVHFLKRTTTNYTFFPVSELFESRGIKNNRLLTSLLSMLPEGCVIAGGFATSIFLEETDASDIDIFCNSEKAFTDVCKLLETAGKGMDPDEQKKFEGWAWVGYKATTPLDKITKTQRFVKYTHEKRIPIQVMKMAWYNNPSHVIDTFDLTIAQFAFTSTHVWCNPISFLDLARKRLVLHRMQFPASTLRRIIKYSKKGFYACPGSLGNISQQIIDYPKIVGDNSPMLDLENVVYID